MFQVGDGLRAETRDHVLHSTASGSMPLHQQQPRLLRAGLAAERGGRARNKLLVGL